MNKKKFIILLISLLLIIAGVLVFNTYNKIYKPSTIKQGFVYIPSKATLSIVEAEMRPFLKRVKPFLWVAKRKKYQHAIKPGRYEILKDMSNNDVVNLLRSGEQTPLIISFNNQHTIEKLAGRISQQIEADSIQILKSFTDQTFLTKNKFTSLSILGMFIPNSYEVYWNTKPEKFRDRMLKEYKRFWNNDRMTKASKLGYTKNQIMTLASIVQKETAKTSERPIVAGLYLNRLKRGWPLQADPTIIFALKQKHGQDFSVKRVLRRDLTISSPYNTYKNKGLPPTPIAMPDISSIDAVLNSTKHSYLYMCASVDKIGYHAFAKTLSQHNRNAAKYHRWINNQGIRR